MATTTTIRESLAQECQPLGCRPHCGVAGVSFSFRGGRPLFADHEGQLGPVRHLLPLAEAQLLVRNLRVIYTHRAKVRLDRPKARQGRQG